MGEILRAYSFPPLLTTLTDGCFEPPRTPILYSSSSTNDGQSRPTVHSCVQSCDALRTFQTPPVGSVFILKRKTVSFERPHGR